MSKVIITGATGMVGGYVLQHCLTSTEIKKVISIVRKPTGIVHQKLEEKVHSDFLNYDGLEEHFTNIDAAYFCIGVYTGAVTDDKFKEITVDYTRSFADKLAEFSPKVKFCFLSGAGADPKEKSRTAFARYKGMAENYLISLNFGSLSIFRPAYIYPVEKRNEPNMMYRISRAFYPLVKAFGTKFSIKSSDLGKGLFLAGLHKPDKVIMENQDILAFLASRN